GRDGTNAGEYPDGEESCANGHVWLLSVARTAGILRHRCCRHVEIALQKCLSHRVEFLVLGPVEVRIDGQALSLGGPKQRALLALLLLRRNEIVPRDQLIDALWGERGPASAQRSLDTYVSRLR